MELRLDEPYSLEELARISGFSVFHFHRIFSGMVGESVKQYERRLRLERAARQLKYESRTVLEIALEAGYESHEAFTRAFAEMFSVPPTHYRKNCALPAEPHAPSSFTSTFRVERIGPLHVVGVRHVGPYAEVGKVWQRLYAYAGQNNLLHGPPQPMAICHDDPEVTPAGKVRCDCCLVVDHPVDTTVDFFQREIAAREYAIALHTGAYAHLHDSYAELAGKWIPTAGREIANLASLEFYRNQPDNTPGEELRTEICLPLED